MTNEDIEIGEAALTAQVQALEGWEAAFVPESAERQGAITIIAKWDSIGAADNPDAVDLKNAAIGLALYQAISDAGYASYVTPEQCITAAVAVIGAVLAARAKAAPTTEASS